MPRSIGEVVCDKPLRIASPRQRATVLGHASRKKNDGNACENILAEKVSKIFNEEMPEDSEKNQDLLGMLKT